MGTSNDDAAQARAAGQPERLAALVEQLRGQVHAVRELDDLTLREAVLSSWARSIDRSPYASLADVPQSPAIMDRSLLRHVNEVDDLTLAFLDVVARFELPIDRDVVLATAILHDVDKPLIFRRGDAGAFALAPGTQPTDHGRLGAAIARESGVPEAVAALVEVHSPFASTGLPETPEGTVMHYADSLANDLAALQYGSPTIHCSFRLVRKDGAPTH